MTDSITDIRKKTAADWFQSLRDQIRDSYESLEDELTGTNSDQPAGRFTVTK